MHRYNLAIGTILLVMSSQPTHAQSFGVFVSAEAHGQLAPLSYIGAAHQKDIYSTGSVLATPSLPGFSVQITQTGANGGGAHGLTNNASASGFVDNGTLHGSVAAVAPNIAGYVDVPPWGIQYTGYSEARAYIGEMWLDTIRVNAPASISSVQISFFTRFDGSLSIDSPVLLGSTGSPVGPTTASFSAQLAGPSGGLPNVTYSHSASDFGYTFNDIESSTYTILPNTDYTLEAQMYLFANAGDQYGPGHSFASVLNSGTVRIGIQTGSGALFSASGLSYSLSPVPEPEQAAVLIFGLIALALYTRRIRRLE